MRLIIDQIFLQSKIRLCMMMGPEELGTDTFQREPFILLVTSNRIAGFMFLSDAFCNFQL